MNRLEHIKQTLPRNLFHNLNYENLEFVILDYNSSDGLEDYIYSEFKDFIAKGKISYYRTEEPEKYNMSHSRNLAYKLATGDVVCNIDADNFTGYNFANYVNNEYNKNQDIYLSSQQTGKFVKNDVLGRLCVKKKDFLAINGYDEKMIYYGFDDFDLTNRLDLSGLKKRVIDLPEYLKAIPHPDSMRMDNSLGFKEVNDIYISYRTPAQSKLLILLNDGSYNMGTILHNRLSKALGISLGRPDEDIFKYSLLEQKWDSGLWSFLPNSLELRNEEGSIQITFPKPDVSKLTDQDGIFHRIADLQLKKSILFFFHQSYNRLIMEDNTRCKRSLVNIEGWGKATICRSSTTKKSFVL